MKIQDFTGGLATRQRPQYLNVNEGAEYSNVNNRVGTLAPVKDKLVTDTIVTQYHTFYDAEAEWVSRDVRTDFLEFQKILYSTDRITTPKKYDGTNTYNLGVAAPPKLTDFTLAEHPEAVVDITFKPNNGGSGLPLEDNYYVLVNADTGKLSNAMYVLVATTGKVTILASNTTSIPTNIVAKVDPGTSNRNITISKPQGITIGADGVEVYRLYKGKYYFVGSLATDTSSLLDSVENVSANAMLDQTKFGVLSGTLQYAMTYLNNEDGTESALSDVSAELDMEAGGIVTLNSLPISTDLQVDKKRIYRVGGNLTTFTLVEEIANADTAYTDILSDTAVDGRLAETIGDGVAPTGLAFLTEAYAMLFGAVGNKLRFTPVGQPNNWPVLNFLTYEADITGLAQVANGVLVFTKFKTHLVTGTGPSSLSSQLLSSSQGCVAFESVVTLSGSAFWVSTDGVCASSGNLPIVLSKDKLDKITLDPVDSTVYDEVYYVVNSDKSILAFDFGSGGIFKSFNFDTLTVAVAEDTLYSWADGVLYKLYGSSSNAEAKYLSPRFIEGRATELKTYKKVYIYSKGDIIVNIIIDDKIVGTKELTGEQTTTLQVPVNLQRGHFIQFDVSGTGEIYEIEYTVGDRKNG